jgi:ferredoxin
MTLPVTIDADRCIGSGMCVTTAPTVFDQNDEDGRALIRSDAPLDREREAVRQAVARCPVGAIQATA